MKPCFLELRESADGQVSAGLLVTDAATRPLEFRITEQLHVDDLQRVLYGAGFEEHLFGTCLAAPLLEATCEQPDAILVRDRRLLAMQGVCELPVLCIERDEADPTGFAILACDDGEEQVAVRAWLGDALRGRDLLEPFERIALALAQIPAEALGARG